MPGGRTGLVIALGTFVVTLVASAVLGFVFDRHSRKGVFTGWGGSVWWASLVASIVTPLLGAVAGLAIGLLNGADCLACTALLPLLWSLPLSAGVFLWALQPSVRWDRLLRRKQEHKRR